MRQKTLDININAFLTRNENEAEKEWVANVLSSQGRQLSLVV